MERRRILYAIDNDTDGVAFMVRDGSTLKPNWETVAPKRLAVTRIAYKPFMEAHYYGITFYDVNAQIAASEEVQT